MDDGPPRPPPPQEKKPKKKKFIPKPLILPTGGMGPNSSNLPTPFQKPDAKTSAVPEPNYFEDLANCNLDDFVRLEELGTGNGGIVTKVQNRHTGLIIAQKLIHLEVKRDVQRRIVTELETLRRCQHDSIVGYYGAFISQANNEIVICMEHMDGRSLDVVLTHAGRIPEPIIGNISIAVLDGLLYLHKTHKIMHRDVKPSNILVNSVGDIKLCDFGVSAQLINSIANSFVGTRSYMAPERLTGQSKYTVKSDIWSLGITFLELAIGFYPIPKPGQSDVLSILQTYPALNARDPSNFNRNAGSMGTGTNPTRTLAIFELLEYIVSKSPPELYYFDPTEGYQEYFTKDFVEFTNSMLKQKMNDRPDLETLMSKPYFLQAKEKKQEVHNYFSEWMTFVINHLYKN